MKKFPTEEKMTGNFIILRLFLSFVFLLNSVDFTQEISCKGEKNKDVDWFVNYKISKIKGAATTYLVDGTGYAYITSSKPGNWKLSSKSIKSAYSMLGNTLEKFYANKKKAAYLLYNDEPPEFGGADHSETSVGHLKGVVAFDKTSGYWLIHSIPKFGDGETYEFPEDAVIYGQSVLCVTFKTSELSKICNQLLYSHPNIYSKGITKEIASILDEKARTIFTDKPDFTTKSNQSSIESLKSKGDKIFMSFSKDNQYHIDIYSSIIAPCLKASLMTETWRRGAGDLMSPSCRSDYQVLNIKSIEMTFRHKRKSVNVFLTSKQDHSKWAISTKSSQKWICIGDLNRMISQKRRGGGALCFYSKSVWAAYNKSIAETDQC